MTTVDELVLCSGIFTVSHFELLSSIEVLCMVARSFVKVHIAYSRQQFRHPRSSIVHLSDQYSSELHYALEESRSEANATLLLSSLVSTPDSCLSVLFHQERPT